MSLADRQWDGVSVASSVCMKGGKIEKGMLYYLQSHTVFHAILTIDKIQKRKCFWGK
jgi:hypothetical protein